MWTPGPWGWEWGEEGPQSAGGGWDEEGTLELWGWEWGIPKCWGVRGGVPKLWGEGGDHGALGLGMGNPKAVGKGRGGTPKCWGMG